MTISEEILLVNFDYPPNRGIGGRRWAKFTRQLAINGYKIHVIKADSLEGSADSAWLDDTVHPNIEITSLPRTYPAAFSNPGKNIIAKLQYRFHKWNLKRKVKGTIYDLSIGWGTLLLPVISDLIKRKNIRTIIATGAPWQMLYDVSTIKKDFPGMRLIVDFRDPWLSATNYGMLSLTDDRRKEEERKQTFVLEQADVVTSPARHITDELKNWAIAHCSQQAQFELLSHFYDPNDFLFTPIESETIKKKEITFVYGGDLYYGMEPQLQNLRHQLKVLQKERPDLYSLIDIKIYTNTPNSTFTDIDRVRIQPPIGKKLFQEIEDSNMCLVMLPDNKKNDLTTKFIEYLPFRKPLLIIASEGDVTRFVTENGIGIVLEKDENSLIEIIEKIIANKIEFNDKFDISSYALPVVTKKLISFFN